MGSFRGYLKLASNTVGDLATAVWSLFESACSVGDLLDEGALGGGAGGGSPDPLPAERWHWQIRWLVRARPHADGVLLRVQPQRLSQLLLPGEDEDWTASFVTPAVGRRLLHGRLSRPQCVCVCVFGRGQTAWWTH